MLPRWPYPDRPGGSFEGEQHGSQVSFFVVDMAPGSGPRLHQHAYSETFLLQAGRARFSLGDERLHMVTIHAAARMETVWLD
jgi:quercetin dioxygenase-like cupin family protein